MSFSVPRVAMIMSEDVTSAVIEDDDSSRRRRKDRTFKPVEHGVLMFEQEAVAM